MKKVFRWMFIVLIVAGMVATFFMLWKRQQPKQKYYDVLRVERGNIEKRTIVTGKLEPRDEVAVKAQIQGIVAEIYKEAGQPVKKGEAIAKIRVVPEMQALSSAESRVRLAEVNLRNVRQVFERDSSLFAKHVIAREDYDRSELQYLQAKEELQNSRDNLSIVREGVTAAAKESGNTIVRSSIDGIILEIPVKVGNSVQSVGTFSEGTTIANVADMSDILFVGKMDETEVGKLHEGMPMDLIIGALNDRRFAAVLEHISPKGTEQNGAMMFEIKGAARIPDSVQVRSGYSANAEIVLDARRQVLVVAEAAVEIKGDSAFVWVLREMPNKETPASEDGMAGETVITDASPVERMPVVIGMSDGINIEVVSGLSENDIIRGNLRAAENK